MKKWKFTLTQPYAPISFAKACNMIHLLSIMNKAKMFREEFYTFFWLVHIWDKEILAIALLGQRNLGQKHLEQ